MFSEIQITSPLNNETIKHTSFKSSLKRINEIVARLKEANSHKNITIHFGTKNKGTNSFMLSHYEKEQRLAQLEIEEEKKYFQDLKQADNEDDLILSEEIHKKSLENIDRLR